jgi:hypothetical protein
MRLAFLSWIILIPSLVSAQGFVDASASAGINHRGFCQSEMTGGVVWFDYDGDGDDDLYTTGGLFDNVLYKNSNGQFNDVTAQSGLTLPPGTHTQGVAAGDINNDGFPDLVVTTWFTQPNYLFLNKGDGTFLDISVSSGFGVDTLWTSAVSFEDFNFDGLLDIYTANYVYVPQVVFDSNNVQVGYAHRCDANSLFINNGDLTFGDVARRYMVADTGCGLALVLSDFDMDNDRDILIANDFGDWITPNVMYRNEWPLESFADISVSAGMDVPMYGMGIASGDFDHDLDFDYYVTDIGPSSLFQNNGNGTFSDIATAAGVSNDSIGGFARTAWGAAFMDYDNDGWEDLFVSNGYIQLLPSLNNARQDPDAMYQNKGNGTFLDVSLSVGFADTNASRGMAVSDYNQDGLLDLFVNVVRIDTNLNENSKLYRNSVNNNFNYIQFKLRGTRNNRDAFGSKVKIKTSGGWQIKELVSGSSHMSQNSKVVHFGLGNSTQVDSVLVIWPDGNSQGFGTFPADSIYEIVEDSTLYLSTLPVRGFVPQLAVGPNPSDSEVNILVSLLRPQTMELNVTDLQGKLVYQENLGFMGMGSHRLEWSGRDFNGKRLPQGLYAITLKGTKGAATKRVMLVN